MTVELLERPRITRRSREDFARQITATWTRAVTNIIETGRVLRKAKAELNHGDWGKLFQNHEVPFDQDQAGRLMAIARHPIIGNSAHARNMPASWYTMFLLTMLPDHLLEAMLADGRIHAGTQRKDVERIKKSLKAPGGSLQTLLAKLRTVEPAIAVNPLVPVLTKFWFTGTNLMAYNDFIGIAVPFASEFTGVVSGRFRYLLEAAGFDNEIKLTATADELVIGNAENDHLYIKLALEAPDIPFVMPQLRRSHPSCQGVGDLVKALAHCLPSVGTDTSKAEYLGVTIVPSEDRLLVYGAENLTLSRAIIPNGIDLRERVLLHGDFCRQLVRLYGELGDQTNVSFGVVDRYTLFQAGDTLLYGPLLEQRNPIDFENVVRQYLPTTAGAADIPERLANAAEVAHLLTRKNRLSSQLTVRSDQLHLHAFDDGESIERVMPFDGHADIAVRVEAAALQRARQFDKMLVSDNAIAMIDKRDWLYLIACHPTD